MHKLCFWIVKICIHRIYIFRQIPLYHIHLRQIIYLIRYRSGYKFCRIQPHSVQRISGWFYLTILPCTAGNSSICLLYKRCSIIGKCAQIPIYTICQKIHGLPFFTAKIHAVIRADQEHIDICFTGRQNVFRQSALGSSFQFIPFILIYFCNQIVLIGILIRLFYPDRQQFFCSVPVQIQLIQGQISIILLILQ